MIRLVLGNTRPPLVLQIKQDGVAVNLTGCTVHFRLKKPSGSIVDRALTVSDPVNGIVTGFFAVGDLNEPGEMYGELEVVFTDGRIQSSEEPIHVIVRPKFVEARL